MNSLQETRCLKFLIVRSGAIFSEARCQWPFRTAQQQCVRIRGKLYRSVRGSLCSTLRWSCMNEKSERQIDSQIGTKVHLGELNAMFLEAQALCSLSHSLIDGLARGQRATRVSTSKTKWRILIPIIILWCVSTLAFEHTSPDVCSNRWDGSWKLWLQSWYYNTMPYKFGSHRKKCSSLQWERVVGLVRVQLQVEPLRNNFKKQPWKFQEFCAWPHLLHVTVSCADADNTGQEWFPVLVLRLVNCRTNPAFVGFQWWFCSM